MDVTELAAMCRKTRNTKEEYVRVREYVTGMAASMSPSDCDILGEALEELEMAIEWFSG